MSTADKKLSLLRMIMESEDDSFITKMINFGLSIGKSNTKDWAEDLPENVKAGIMKGLEQSENGESVPHEVVLAQMKEKYPHLNL